MIAQQHIGKQTFTDIASGRRTFIIREKSVLHVFTAGDYIALNETDNGSFTGRAILTQITHIAADEYGLDEDKAVLCLQLCDIKPRDESRKSVSFEGEAITRNGVTIVRDADGAYGVDY